MKPKTLILMLVAVACGLVAAFLASQYSPSASTANKVPVLVAKIDLAPGQVLNDPNNQLVAKGFDPDIVPPGAVQNIEDLRGKVIARGIDKNTPVTTKDLSMAESLFPKTLPAGYRAVTVRVTVESAIAGFVLPGSYVDLLCTLPDPTDARKSLTKTFMQNVMVLAVNTMKDLPKEGGGVIPNATTVTFAIKPEDVERLESAKNRGQIAMSLRRPGEKEVVETKGVTNPFMAADAAKGGTDGTGDKTQTVKVWVAEETIKPLTDISKEMAERSFKLVSYPQALAHSALTEKDSLVGRVEHLVPAGFPITKEHYQIIGGTVPVGPGGKRGVITVMTVIEGTKVPQEYVFENGRIRRPEDREGLPEPDQKPKGKGSEGPSEN
jgi:pilus assembly protein CpaB